MNEPFLGLRVSLLNVRFTSWTLKIKLFFGRLLRKNVWVYYPWVGFSWGQLKPLNLGDDLNVTLLSRNTKDVLLPGCYYCNSPWGTRIGFPWMNSLPKLACIGSILHTIEYDNTVIWGSGLLTEKHLPTHKLDIRAVRGPLTRQVLLGHGFDCPEVYGDPALLLPYFYKPTIEKKRYRLGIIPHYSDIDKEPLTQFKKDSSVLIISMTNYGTFQNVVDQICSCEVIASSSLHGLILAEAYNISNVWIEINEAVFGDESRRFKFHDFFLSQGRDRECPFVIKNNVDVNSIIEKRCSPIGGSMLIEKLISACPFRMGVNMK